MLRKSNSKKETFKFIKNIRKEKCHYDFINQCLTFLIKTSPKTYLRAHFKRRPTGYDGLAAKKEKSKPN